MKRILFATAMATLMSAAVSYTATAETIKLWLLDTTSGNREVL